MALVPTDQEVALLQPLVQHYSDDIGGKRLISTFLNSLIGYIEESNCLKTCVHSHRSRLKDPTHLFDKLLRKKREADSEGRPFDIVTADLFTRITDLAGIRLLHLHSRQFGEIDRCLKEIIAEQPIELVEGPIAHTWDDEYRALFTALGAAVANNPRMYTSVHYVVASRSTTTVTCEIQVRTLMEEVWGEVDHSVNYPHPNENVACTEQIRALARSTSSATRLVDAIFATVEDLARRADR